MILNKLPKIYEPIILAILFFIACPIFTSCKKENTTSSVPQNKPPVANAGSAQNIYWPTNSITLIGSGTDVDGTISRYKWRKISEPNYHLTHQIKINNPDSAKTVIESLVVGTYQFEFKVTDNGGASSGDTISITIIDTLTTRGKEYTFQNKIWGSGEWATINSRWNELCSGGELPFLFYDNNREIEVSILMEGFSTWLNIPLSSPPSYTAPLYTGYSYTLFYGVCVNLNPENLQLNGTKASIKVKFL